MSSSISAQIINFITVGIPECIALTCLTLVLLKLKINWPRVFIIAMVMSITVLLFRLVAMNVGIHTAMAIIAMAVLVSHLFPVSKLSSMIASTIAVLYLMLCELIVFMFYKLVLSIDIKELINNSLYWTLALWPQIFLILAATFLITHTAWYIRGKKHKNQ